MNRHWIGNGGNWSDTAHWSASSGGSGGASVPTSSDNAIFDANSFSSASQTVTLNVAGSCADMDWTGVTNTPTFAGSQTLQIFGSFTLVSGMTWSHTGAVQFRATATGKTITTAGKTISPSSGLLFGGVGGGWTLQDALTCATSGGGLELQAGTLNTNGQTVTTRGFSSNITTNPRTLTLGASTINLTATGITAWSVTAANLTINAGTSTIALASGSSFSGGGFTYSTVTTIRPSTISGGNTFTNLTITGTSGGLDNTTFSENQVITGTLTINGLNQTNRILIKSSAIGSSVTIAAATVSLSNVDFRDVIAAGAAAPFTGTSIGDCLGNSNITFTSPVTRYWIGNAGSWSATSHWSTSSGGSGGASMPLPQDTARFDANSFSTGSQTVTFDRQNLSKDIDFTGVTNSPTLNLSLGFIYLFGSLNLSGIGSVTGTANRNIIFQTRTTATITPPSVSIQAGIYIQALGGLVTLLGNIDIAASTTSSGTVTLTTGTFDANDFNVTCRNYFESALAGITLYMGNGTWTLKGSNTGYVWQNTIGSIIAEESTIVIDDAGANTKQFSGGASHIYNNLTITGSNVEILNDETFNTLTISPGKTVKFDDAKTVTVTTFAVNGTAGNLITLRSTVDGTRFNLSKASGVVTCEYLDIKDSNATGGATWNATNSVNSGNNLGWIFLVTKTLTESISITEAFVRQAIRVLSDAIVLSESRIIGTARSVADAINLSDAITKSVVFFRSFAESIGLTEVFTKSQSIIRVLSETIITVETIVVNYSKSKIVSDTLGVFDSAMVTFNGIVTAMWQKLTKASGGMTKQAKDTGSYTPVAKDNEASDWDKTLRDF